MKRLIVLADNSLIVEAIRSGLRESGVFHLLGYTNVRNASAHMIIDTGADVVLMDEADQSERAITLIKNIRDETDRVTVILLVMHMEGEFLIRALEAGATGAISKAVHPTALATLVREALNGHIVHSLSGLAVKNGKPKEDIVERCALTDRELEIVQLVAAGATNGEIARRLWITEQTVKFHVSNIYRKLNVANRTEACHYAHVNGLVVLGQPVGLGPASSNANGASRERRQADPPRHASRSANRRIELQPRADLGAA